MRRRRKIGRLNVKFDIIEQLASEIAGDVLFLRPEIDWRLTKHSAIYACKDGSLTVCLVWHAPGTTVTRTVRGIRRQIT